MAEVEQSGVDGVVVVSRSLDGVALQNFAVF